MFKKVLHFVKYNNAMIFIVVIVFLLGTGVFAQTETGKDVIGQKKTTISGIDNTLLLEADLDKLDMDYAIEKINQDDNYYYVTYTFLELVNKDNAWQYQIQEKQRKISKKIRVDLGSYLAEEFVEEYEDKMRYLKNEKRKAKQVGEEKRLEVAEYDGLIGQTLNLAAKVFPAYDSIRKNELPTPAIPLSVIKSREDSITETEVSNADDLTQLYNDFIRKNDPDGDDVFSDLDNCPDVFNPDQFDKNNNGVGDICEESIIPVDDDLSTSSEDSSVQEISSTIEGDVNVIEDTVGQEALGVVEQEQQIEDENGLENQSQENNALELDKHPENFNSDDIEVEIIELPEEEPQDIQSDENNNLESEIVSDSPTETQ